jgi:hypothetical protein
MTPALRRPGPTRAPAVGQLPLPFAEDDPVAGAEIRAAPPPTRPEPPRTLGEPNGFDPGTGPPTRARFEPIDLGPPGEDGDDRPHTGPRGGFMGSVNVLTEAGYLEISRVASNRMAGPVACVDPDTGLLVFRPVTDWTCRVAHPSELVLLESYARGGCGRSQGGHRALRVASGQAIHGPGGPRRAGDLGPGSAVYTPGTRLETWQEQVVIGSLLGDAYSAYRRAGRYGGLSICHGETQRGYLEWKFARLANIGAKPPSVQKLSPGGFAVRPTSRFTTRAHPQVSDLAAEFYGGAKRPPPGIVARAGWPGVGIWFGDDGGCIYSNKTRKITTFRFHTNAFAPEEVDRLGEELSRLSGLPWRRHLQNGAYPLLTLGNGDGTRNNKGQGNLARWAELIRPHVPPMLAYKLRVEDCGQAWSGLEPPGGQWPEQTSVKSARPYAPAPHENCLVYHLGVAGVGNFVAQGLVVADAHSSGGTDGNRDAR